MEIDKEKQETYKEIITILNNMEKEYQEKIPKKLIRFFEKNSAKEYKFDIDLNIPFKEQKLKSKTVTLLAILNLNYWCKNEEEKKELIKKYSENEKKYQEELREKYNPDNLFKSKERNIEAVSIPVAENMQLVEYKEPKWYKKIFEKILNFFK